MIVTGTLPPSSWGKSICDGWYLVIIVVIYY